MSVEIHSEDESRDQVDEFYQTVHETGDTNFGDFSMICKWARSSPTKMETIFIQLAGVENLRKNLIPIDKELKKDIIWISLVSFVVCFPLLPWI